MSKLPWLQALCVAWPFRSRAAFERGLVRLERDAQGSLEPKGGTRAMAAELLDFVRPRAGAVALDVLEHACDEAWFEGGAPSLWRRVELADLLLALARRRLHLAGGEPHVAEISEGVSASGFAPLGGPGAAERGLAQGGGELRWMTLALPEDLLVAALYAACAPALGARHEPTRRSVRLATPAVMHLLERGVANTHVHASGAFDFSLLWAQLALRCARAKPGAFEGEDRKLLPEGFEARLVAAFVARLVLAEFLAARRRAGGGGPREGGEFAAGLGAPAGGRDAPGAEAPPDAPGGRRGPFERFFNDFFDRCSASGALSLLDRALLVGGVASLVDARRDPPKAGALVKAYAKLAFGPHPKDVRSLEGLAAADPVGRAFGWSAHDPGLHECRFASHALRYLVSQDETDEPFAKLFWQYQRARNALFAYVTQEPGTPGLAWFEEHFRRFGSLVAGDFLESHIFHAALQVEGADVRLEALELRVRPKQTWDENRAVARRVARCALEHDARAFGPSGPAPARPAPGADPRPPEPGPSPQAPEIGLVFHWIKSARDHKKALHGNPPTAAGGLRHGTWVKEAWKLARALAKALDQEPELLLVVRGVDVANRELEVPSWAALLPLRHVREASEGAARRLAQDPRLAGVGPLRFTCHAGEDYRRIEEGLRRVHELIECGLLRAGDRVGHGLALGDDPERWQRTLQVELQPLEDRLDDLLWELDRYYSGEVPPEPGRVDELSDEAAELGARMYGGAVSVEALRRARRERFDPNRLRLEGYGWPVLAVTQRREAIGADEVVPAGETPDEGATDARSGPEAWREARGEPEPWREARGEPDWREARSEPDWRGARGERGPGRGAGAPREGRGGLGAGNGGRRGRGARPEYEALDPVEELVDAYARDPATFARGRGVVRVRRRASDVAAQRKLQAFVCAALARREITVEANPSSNLLVSSLDGVEGHPIFRLRSPRPDGAASVSVSLNTDDPLTFATRLADEYAHVYFAMLRSGISADAALAWLDAAREAGLRSRFTVPASRDPQVLRALLDPHGRGKI
ncbi:MAG TPA: hypothetical protein VFS43_33525 [Polyangiaceae bacterium]|nr:hypothetical protein [Polyangiaceae bacterium]